MPIIHLVSDEYYLFDDDYGIYAYGNDYNSNRPDLLNEPVLLNNLIPNNNRNRNVPTIIEEPVSVNNIPNELEELPEPFMNIEPFDNMGAAFSRF